MRRTRSAVSRPERRSRPGELAAGWSTEHARRHYIHHDVHDGPKQVICAKFVEPLGQCPDGLHRSHRQPSAKAFDLNTTMWTAFCVAGLQYCRSCPTGDFSRFELASAIALSLMCSLRTAVRGGSIMRLASMFP